MQLTRNAARDAEAPLALAGAVTRSVLVSAIGLFALSAASAASAGPGPAGAEVFRNNCQSCHQVEGVGVPGQFPRLAGRAPAIAATPGGRKFLSLIVLNGMSGSIACDGQTVAGFMPGFPHLSDVDLAAALTYVTSLGAGPARPAAFMPAEIAAARAGGAQSPSAVAGVRKDLVARKIIP